MSARTYLSIGDVLSLLREEFPDVTISKIRFLESQGLVDPERSPSGYRKFYERDVDRLRWVLRQQREHFLPLKVIRDRLAAAGNGVPSDDVYQGAGSRNGSGNPDADPGDDVAESELAESELAESELAERFDDAADDAADGAGEEEDAEEGAVAAAFEVGDEASGNNVVPITAERSPLPGAHPSRLATHVTAEATAPLKGLVAPSPPSAPTAPAPSADPAPRAPASSGPPAGDSLTLEELCAVSGLTPADVASLERFGLVRPVAVAGGLYYEEEALEVAKLVVGFGRFGVEPRHLRLYRNAVDREIALVEQIVTPLLRQRNPEARRRAAESADELAHLGQRLRASLVRAELRHKLGH